MATGRIENLLDNLGLTRHPSKGEWIGATRVEHLGIVIDSLQEKFYIAPRKIKKVRRIARPLIRECNIGRRWVSAERLRSFVGVCVSLSCAMPYARFYTRSLYWDLPKKSTYKARPEPKAGIWKSIRVEKLKRIEHNSRSRCRLSHQSLRDLHTWCALTSTEREGRPLRPAIPEATLHTDAADLGYGGTLGPLSNPGEPGLWEAQGVWGWEDRANSISYRELKAVRFLLTKQRLKNEPSFGKLLKNEGIHNLDLQCDNLAVVHIAYAMVSASRPMMRELRLLKRELDHIGVTIAAKWLPSVLNKYADALSQRFPHGDLRVRRCVRQSVPDGMQAPSDSFPYRPRGEHPVFIKQQTITELQANWDRNTTRLLCPPIDLIPAVLQKLSMNSDSELSGRLTESQHFILIHSESTFWTITLSQRFEDHLQLVNISWILYGIDMILLLEH